MLDVFLTVDVEIWCNGWKDIDREFPQAFSRYVYGPTATGSFGLPYQLQVLNDHGLQGVFFVEPLFSTRFGREPLAEIVGLLKEAGQDVQLHLHTEWVDEARVPLVPLVGRKRQYLRHFSRQDQQTLIAAGRSLLAAAGAESIQAFRAGSFGFNRDTLRALAELGIPVDSSYNACAFGLDSGVMPGVTLVDACSCEGVIEYPMTVFRDGTRALRPAQITACSFSEMEGLLWRALEEGRQSFTVLSHNFELLNRNQDRADPVVIRRYRKLCAFLDRHRNLFRVAPYRVDARPTCAEAPPPLSSPRHRTVSRIIEQAYRRRFQ